MTDSRLSLVVRKSLKYLKGEFPRASKEHCSSRQGVLCGITEKPCEFDSCPKIKEKIREERG